MKPIMRKLRNFKVKKSAIEAVGIILAIGVLSTVGISIYVGWNLTHPAHKSVTEPPSKYGLKFESITFTSIFDGINLRGWWIPAQKNGRSFRSNRTVIFSHGYGDTRAQEYTGATNLANRLASEGYNTLLFDFRNCGESEDKVTGIGQFEKDDLLSAINYAKEVKKSKTIALIGWSMGAATSILAGAESPDVKVIIADSPFAELSDYLKENMNIWSGLPNIPFTPIIMNIIPPLTGVYPNKVSPCSAAANLGERKLMLIHSRGDKSIPYSNSERIFSVVPDKSSVLMWIPQKPGHIETYRLHRQEYEARVVMFLERNFK
ncbi:MAG: alpha/beta hydrolase [Clostridia bacterium]|nr:alpha/beta hydrolase [Clostridia bacterium]